MREGMDAITQAWVDAGLQLSKDPTLKITCPECGKGTLVCLDEPTGDPKQSDRYMICSDCRKWNKVTIDNPVN
ncbi:MAG: hypothetical protein IPP93_12650 [Chitinophagaceae bacterium]|nr:hypothetical protein [Chitinophagaceae bacterium]MBL0336773.1 hypothetical protein [Chitinophagaceae bacterium]